MRLPFLDVALFAYVPALATCASIAQQLHTIVRWRDIKIAQHHHTVKHLREPELAVTGASVGVDLVLFYIRTASAFEALPEALRCRFFGRLTGVL